MKFDGVHFFFLRRLIFKYTEKRAYYTIFLLGVKASYECIYIILLALFLPELKFRQEDVWTFFVNDTMDMKSFFAPVIEEESPQCILGKK